MTPFETAYLIILIIGIAGGFYFAGVKTGMWIGKRK